MRYIGRILTIAMLALVPGVVAPAAHAGALRFEAPGLLPHGDPDQHPFIGGGEPSIAFDPSGDGHVYVTAPQGIPTALGGLLGLSDSLYGVGYWASDDHGASWPTSGFTGSLIGGGDSDVEVLQDHTVLVADLEAAAAAICTSTDFARSFPDCGGGLATNQEGPENDRQWLTRGTRPGEAYLTYHDFAGGFPIVERSTDSGATFTPCGLIIDPSGPAAKQYTPTGGTLVSKPVVAPDGTLYVLFSIPSSPAPVGAKINNLYVGVAKGGCTGATRFTDHLVYSDPGADLAKIFQQLAIDGSGRLYAFAAGQLTASEQGNGAYLFTSSDGAKTWSPPIKVNPPELKANVFPTVAGGQGAGEALLGWFGTQTSGDPNDTKAQWRFYAAATYDGGRTFNLATVTPDVIHHGDICTQGLFCGLIPGQPSNRNLADFASAAIDPSSGCAAFAIPGDPYNRPDLPDGKDTAGSSAYVSRQQDASACLTAANAGKAAPEVGPSAASSGTPAPGGGCADRARPAVRVSRARSASRRRGIRLSGTASDRGCGAKGRGVVRRVEVAVAQRSGTRCRFLTSRGRAGAPRPCSRARYLRATGTSRWRLRLTGRLARGRYVAYVRATDAAGNRGRPAAVRLRVR